MFNSLAPGKFEWNFRYLIYKWISVIDGWGISDEIVLIITIWISLDFADDQSTLVQVMAWCRQATSHYLSQCWPRSLSPYGVTRPQWLKIWKIKPNSSSVPLKLKSFHGNCSRSEFMAINNIDIQIHQDRASYNFAIECGRKNQFHWLDKWQQVLAT